MRRTIGIVALVALLSSASAGGAVADDWPMFHHDPTHTGVSTDGTISTANVGTVGLDWAANTGAASYTSPVVAHSASLGKDLVYAANQVGSLSAYDAQTGDRQWVLQLASSIQSSPAVVNNVIYFGANDHKMYAVNASSGAIICSYLTPGNISSSPTVVDPDGSGLVVYFGENGITGADDGGDEFAVNAVDPNAAADCSLKWTKSIHGDYGGANLAGSWSPPAFATDVNGRALIVFGGSSPDCAVYAVDALTGALVWRFQTQIFAQDNDVGAGPTITAPGVNGFADGVVYVAGKDRILYALNLRTGAKIWQFSIRADSVGVGGATRSTAAYLNGVLYIGYGAGVYADRRRHRTEGLEDPGLRRDDAGGDLLSGDHRPGGLGREPGDVRRRYERQAVRVRTGRLQAVPVLDGKLHLRLTRDRRRPRLHHQQRRLSLRLRARRSDRPEAEHDHLVAGGRRQPAQHRHRQRHRLCHGQHLVTKVLVAIKNKNSGAWWNSSTQKWTKTFNENLASLGNPGGASTSWSTSFPVPMDGGPFLIQASAVDSGGQHDPTPDSHSVLVAANGNPPETTIIEPGVPAGVPSSVQHQSTRPVHRAVLHPGQRQRGRLRWGEPRHRQGVRLDPQHRARRVQLRPGYVGASRGCWQPTFTSQLATLANPGCDLHQLDVPVPDLRPSAQVPDRGLVGGQGQRGRS